MIKFQHSGYAVKFLSTHLDFVPNSLLIFYEDPSDFSIVVVCIVTIKEDVFSSSKCISKN